jgi:ubiquitin carboxyl-terminal hydrolase 14
MLKCNIDGNTNHLHEGLVLGLKDDREINSEKLGRPAVFKGSSVLVSLPEYLTVQMVRFFYKASVQQKAKVLRKV